MLSANMNYNNLGSSGSDVSVLLPEQKSIPRSAQQGRLMASYERVSSSQGSPPPVSLRSGIHGYQLVSH